MPRAARAHVRLALLALLAVSLLVFLVVTARAADEPRAAGTDRPPATGSATGSVTGTATGTVTGTAAEPAETPPVAPPRAAVRPQTPSWLQGGLREGLRALRDAAYGPPRVGIQVGHLDVAAHPDELAGLRASTGGHWDGVDEVDVNAAVAEALAERLEAAGVRVDVLPATLPPGYRADALVSLHADASPDPWRRGYKSAHFLPRRNGLEPLLKAYVDAAYLAASGLPDDDANTTGRMLRYYAFNHEAYRHAASPHAPSLIVEMGYLSHPADRAWLLSTDEPAEALAEGILGYLRARALLPPPPAPTPARRGR